MTTCRLSAGFRVAKGCCRLRSFAVGPEVSDGTAVALLAIAVIVVLTCGHEAAGATRMEKYYAHAAVEDAAGVIAPWYQGQNGQLDLRVRVSADFLKRYPWVDAGESVVAGPHWVFNPRVELADDGAIKVLAATPQMNGNLGQRFKYITESLTRYYRYSGDPVVFGYLKIAADYLLDYYQTPADHSWPQFPVSVPLNGAAYGPATPGGYIQLDLSAGIGLGMIRVYQMTGDRKYWEAACHWGDVLAEKCDRRTGMRPWNRYANPQDVAWGEQPNGNVLTGGVVNILIFLDELIRLGYTGTDGSVVTARDAGRRYLSETLLPAWLENDTWGRHYWDWEHPVQGILPTGWVVPYLMDHQEEFPLWRSDVRNLLGLYLNRACVSPNSNGDVYSGAWAYPEGCACCGRSLDFCPVFLARYWARYAVEADSEWAREIARRTVIMGTYHFHESGKVEDNIDGGQITASNWSELIGFGPILCGLEIMAWLPEELGARRENHLVRSTSIVTSIVYGRGRVDYQTFDAPAPCVDALRLAYQPDEILADGQQLPLREKLDGNGFTLRPLPCGDWIVTVRHDDATSLSVSGPDPQAMCGDCQLDSTEQWQAVTDPASLTGELKVAHLAGARATWRFHGNQLRLIGRVDSGGGRADVLLDGVRQPTVIDCWTPGDPRQRQVLFYGSGLADGPHELTVVAQGRKNAYSQGTRVSLDALLVSSATAQGSDEGARGPVEPQRMIFGYPKREPYVDTAGQAWRPATEFVVRTGHNTDSVTQSWWTQPMTDSVAGTTDPELYRYGVHGREFWANLTVGPGSYQVRLLFADTRPPRHRMSVHINGQEVESQLDVASRAGGRDKALVLTCGDVHPQAGIIEVRLIGIDGDEAMIQSLELIPESGK